MTNPLKLKAEKTSPCICGSWVRPGDTFLWDKEKNKTVGCPACEGKGHPDPHADIDVYAEDFGIFHD